MKNWEILKKHKLPKESATMERYFVLVINADRHLDIYGCGFLNVGYERFNSLQVYNDHWFFCYRQADNEYNQKLKEIL